LTFGGMTVDYLELFRRALTYVKLRLVCLSDDSRFGKSDYHWTNSRSMEFRHAVGQLPPLEIRKIVHPMTDMSWRS
jgi:hypothetical protein